MADIMLKKLKTIGWISLAIAGSLGLGSCQDNTRVNRVNECYTLHETINQFGSYPITSDRAAMVEYGQQVGKLATAIAALPLTDATLMTYQTQFSQLYQEQRQVILAKTEFMNPDGSITLTGQDVLTIDLLTDQQRQLGNDLQSLQVNLRVYCSTGS